MKITVDLHPAQVKLIDRIIPFLAENREEAIKFILSNWLLDNRTALGVKS